MRLYLRLCGGPLISWLTISVDLVFRRCVWGIRIFHFVVCGRVFGPTFRFHIAGKIWGMRVAFRTTG